tara:strand:- start:4 stop:684 length:681 start_codon:yes stop_codon:yes gene_type:complete
MVFKNKNKLIYIFTFFFLNLNLYANIIYDKNDVIISELDLNYYKQMHFEKFNEKLNNAKALKNLVIVKKVIVSLKINNPNFLDKIDQSIDREIGKSNIRSEIILDIIRYFRTRNEFIYDYFNNNFELKDLKKVFKTINVLELPISENNCLTIMRLVDLSNNNEFLKVFFESMKSQSNVYEISINDMKYNVCVDQRNKKKIEKEIFKYVDLKIQDNFNKFVYEQQKK